MSIISPKSLNAGANRELLFHASYEEAMKARTQGDLQSALEEFEKAISLARSMDDGNEKAYNCILGAARCHFKMGDNENACSLYEEALNLMENGLAQSRPNRYSSLLWELAIFYSESEKFGKAIEFFQKSMEVTIAAKGANERFIADCLWGLSKCYCAIGELSQAVSVIREALRMYECCESDVEELIHTNLSNLATVLIELGNFEEASKTLENLLSRTKKPKKTVSAINNQTSTNSSKNSSKSPDYPELLSFQALLQEGMHDCFRERNEEEELELSVKLAWCYKKTGRYKEAEKLLKDTLRQSRRIFDRFCEAKQHRLKASPKSKTKKECSARQLKSNDSTNTRSRLSSKTSKKKLDYPSTNNPPLDKTSLESDRQSLLIEIALAHTFNCQGKHQQAERILKRTINILAKDILPSPDSEICGAMYELALCYLKQNKLSNAESLFLELLKIHEEKPLVNPEMFADTLFQLGSISGKSLKHRKGREYFERSLDIREKIYGFENEDVATCMLRLADCLRKINEHHEAHMVQRQAEEILELVRTSS